MCWKTMSRENALTRLSQGGFKFWLATYKDNLFDRKANDEAYKFWVKKTRARITDPRKRDMMAPLKAPHPWGTKRPSLEQNFYEAMDRPENDVVDIKNNPVKEVTEKGIVTEDGVLREFDLIALATGFDAVTGGMKNMGLLDINGVDLKERWSNGTYSHIGMACADFPNMFFCKLNWYYTRLVDILLTPNSSIRSTRTNSFQQRPQLC